MSASEFPEDMPMMHRVLSLSLGGNAPRPVAGSRTKTMRLAAIGWRILPIPTFWAARELLHDASGNGNPAFIDFNHPREWLVIPPESVDLPAQKFTGRRLAIAWAWSRAMGEQS